MSSSLQELGTEAEISDKEEDLPPRLRLVKATDISPAFKDKYSTAITHVGTSGQKITVIDDLSHLVNLKYLCLRSNIIRSIAGVNSLTSLVHLELYENRIKSLSGLENLVNLAVLDLSYNRIRYLDEMVLKNLTKLRKLFIAQNKLERIEGLQYCTELELLDFGMNRIEKIENLTQLVNLQELWLGKNKIKVVEGLSTLKKLKRLDIQSNRLTKLTRDSTIEVCQDSLSSLSITEREARRKSSLQERRHSHLCSTTEHNHGHQHHHRRNSQEKEQSAEAQALNCRNEADSAITPLEAAESINIFEKKKCEFEQISEFDSLPGLEELYLSHQGIEDYTGLEKLANLRILDLTANKIASLKTFKGYQFADLEDLWLGENKIEGLEEVGNLDHFKHLDTIYLERNPMEGNVDYKAKILTYLPWIKQLDAVRHIQ